MVSDFKQTEIGLIPEDWRTGLLKKFTKKIGSGATPKGGQKSYLENGEYSLIRSKNIFDDKFDYDGLAHINEAQAEELQNVEVMERDVLLNITGASLGRVHIVPKEILPARVNQHVSIIRTNNKLDSYFLYCFLCQNKIKEYMMNFNAGATREALTKGMIEDFTIPIPSLEEQRRIGKIFKIFDDKIELNNKMNETLEKIGQALFKHWFIDFEFPNEEGKPYKSSGGEMVDSELGMIPKEWKVKNLGELTSFLKDGTHNPPKRKERGIKFIAGATNIKHFNVEFDKCTFISKEEYDIIHKKYDIMENDILLTIVGTVGNVALVKNEDLPFSLQRSIAIFRPNKNINYQYLYFLFNTNIFQNFLKSHINPTAQPGIYLGTLSSFEFWEPKKEICESFGKITNLFINQMKNYYLENVYLKKVRDKLLPKLISGKIRVI